MFPVNRLSSQGGCRPSEERCSLAGVVVLFITCHAALIVNICVAEWFPVVFCLPGGLVMCHAILLLTSALSVVPGRVFFTSANKFYCTRTYTVYFAFGFFLFFRKP